MTVVAHNHDHGLDLKGKKAFLSYFDSVFRARFPKQGTHPQQYALYFAVPTDIYDNFSNMTQSITGPLGVQLDTAEATQAELASQAVDNEN
eukprot:scaffold38871_cov34-Attheya_sp.AAC.1